MERYIVMSYSSEWVYGWGVWDTETKRWATTRPYTKDEATRVADYENAKNRRLV